MNQLIWNCQNTSCQLRLVTLPKEQLMQCPLCRGTIRSQPEKHTNVAPRKDISRKTSGPFPFELYLDNIRSAYNVGSIFRSADAVGIVTIHLGGISPLPIHPKVAKTALGATEHITWKHHPNGLTAIQTFKQQGYQVWTLELTATAENLLYRGHTEILPTGKILLVVGNEVTGVDPAILSSSDKMVFLPMVGQKGSLNVAVATGAALYVLRHWWEN